MVFTGERRRGGLRSSCWRMMTRHGNRRQNAARNVSTRQHAHQQGRIISGRCAKPSAGHMPGWDYISPMVRHSGNTLDRKIAVSDGGRDFSRLFCASKKPALETHGLLCTGNHVWNQLIEF